MQKAFCNRCGGGLIDGVCPKCADAAYNPIPQARQADPSARFRGFFMSPKEKLVCTLGNTYVQSFLSGGGATKGFSVVSDKRVYFRGTTFWVEGKKIRKMQESKTVDLKDVTGTSVTFVSNPWMPLLGGFISFFSFVLLMIVAVGGVYDQGLAVMFIIGGVLGLLIGISFIIAYFMTRINLLKVEYAGGCIGFDIRWFPMQEAETYQKQLRLAKDKAIEEAENATANAVTSAVSQITAVQPVAVAAPASSAQELMQYADLFEKGLITREEFDEFKAGVLKK
jgi:hypothetical protein